MRIILANVMADVNLTYSNVNTCTDQNTLAKVNMNISCCYGNHTCMCKETL